MRFQAFFATLFLWVFKLLIYLLPTSFRRDYGDELLLDVREILRRTEGRGRFRIVSVGIWCLSDVFCAAVREHFQRGRRPIILTTKVATVAALLVVCVYFVHDARHFIPHENSAQNQPLSIDCRNAGAAHGAKSAQDAGCRIEDVQIPLKERPEIDSKRIGMLGHSAGGGIAIVAASTPADLAFLTNPRKVSQ